MKSEWSPARTAPFGEKVLVTLTNGGQVVASRNKDNDWGTYHVTHWMPLPQSPAPVVWDLALSRAIEALGRPDDIEEDTGTGAYTRFWSYSRGLQVTQWPSGETAVYSTGTGKPTGRHWAPDAADKAIEMIVAFKRERGSVTHGD